MEEEHVLVPPWTLTLSGDSELPAGSYSRFWRRGTCLCSRVFGKGHPSVSKHSPVQPACQVPSPCKSGFSSGQLAPVWVEKQEAPPLSPLCVPSPFLNVLTEK